MVIVLYVKLLKSGCINNRICWKVLQWYKKRCIDLCRTARNDNVDVTVIQLVFHCFVVVDA